MRNQNWVASSEKVPSSMRKTCGFKLSCARARFHSGLCFPFLHSIVSNFSRIRQQTPWSESFAVHIYSKIRFLHCATHILKLTPFCFPGSPWCRCLWIQEKGTKRVEFELAVRWYREQVCTAWHMIKYRNKRIYSGNSTITKNQEKKNRGTNNDKNKRQKHHENIPT